MELLARLSDQADQESTQETGPVAEKRSELSRYYPPANREKLTGIFKKSDKLDLRIEKAFVYAPTVRDSGPPLLPVMTINADFSDSNWCWISIYVMCWVFHKKQWSVLPLRFERPPQTHMTGAHGYSHVQLFWSLFSNTSTLPDGEKIIWFPTKQPAVPLPQDGNTPAILASAIVSLYGMIAARAYVADLQNTQYPFWGSSTGARAPSSTRSGLKRL